MQVLGWEAFALRVKRIFPKKAKSSNGGDSERGGRSKGKTRASLPSAQDVAGSSSKHRGGSPAATDLERAKMIYFSSLHRDAEVTPAGGVTDPRAQRRLAMLRQAREAYAGTTGSQPAPPTPSTSQPPTDPSQSEPRATSVKPQEKTSKQPPPETLPFFARTIALMAVGAAHDASLGKTHSDPHASPDYLFALAQQVATVWIESGEPLSLQKPPAEMIRDARADYVRTHLICLRYLLADVTSPASPLGSKHTRKDADRATIMSLVRNSHLY